MAGDGRVVAGRRVPDGLTGLQTLHELLASLADDPAEVVVGTETDRGLLVGALIAAGYQVYAVNPLAASRYRERHTISGAKSDRADGRMLAGLVRTDGTITAKRRVTRAWPRRSRCWPSSATTRTVTPMPRPARP